MARSAGLRRAAERSSRLSGSASHGGLVEAGFERVTAREQGQACGEC
jgi:hypothetical protein